MTNTNSPQPRLSKADLVLLRHTPSNSTGKVITYFAHPDLSGIKLSPFTFDPEATLTSSFYATSWEVGISMGCM